MQLQLCGLQFGGCETKTGKSMKAILKEPVICS